MLIPEDVLEVVLVGEKRNWLVKLLKMKWNYCRKMGRSLEDFHNMVRLEGFWLLFEGWSQAQYPQALAPTLYSDPESGGLQWATAHEFAKMRGYMRKRRGRAATGFVGVYRVGRGEKPRKSPFVAYFQLNGKRVMVGFFKTPEEASQARSRAMKQAGLNVQLIHSAGMKESISHTESGYSF